MIYKALTATIRAALPIEFTARGGPRVHWYKIAVVRRAKTGSPSDYVAKVLIYPNCLVRASLNQGTTVDRKLPHPKRTITVNLNDPGSVETLEGWLAKFTAIK